MAGNDTQKELPPDVIPEIIIRLPAKPFLRCTLVCSSWNEWISNDDLDLAARQSELYKEISGFFSQDSVNPPDFLTYDNYSYNIPLEEGLPYIPEIFKMVSSSRGLLLCEGILDFYVCNPVNRQRISIKKFRNQVAGHPSMVIAFEPSVSRFYLIDAASTGSGLSLDIYSSSENEWKHYFFRNKEQRSKVVCGGFYTRGRVYWLLKSQRRRISRQTRLMVLTFDIQKKTQCVSCLPSAATGILLMSNIEEYYYIKNISGTETKLLLGVNTIGIFRRTDGQVVMLVTGGGNSRLVPHSTTFANLYGIMQK
ncbi:F-box protein At5g07610-like [Cornus florida]|uniref:F-box protein At5g07610-like n=1 Tax=Cornus florida TaxID=4283 RepID=UPI00289A8684|nr:F-box protein At5g07610-like [Cornus florida]